MNFLCRLLIWSLLVAHRRYESKHKKRDQAKMQSLMAAAISAHHHLTVSTA